MSTEEAKTLINFGREWLSHVFIRADIAARDRIIATVNSSGILKDLNIKVGRGWQKTDPIVKIDNKAHTYEALVKWAVNQDDGGVDVAKQFRKWYSTDDKLLSELVAHLKALAVITHFAEVGRGYADQEGLYAWIDTIAEASDAATAKSRWNTYRDSYRPSLKYDQDLREKSEYSANQKAGGNGKDGPGPIRTHKMKLRPKPY